MPRYIEGFQRRKRGASLDPQREPRCWIPAESRFGIHKHFDFHRPSGVNVGVTPCSASVQNLTCGVQRHTIHPPRPDRARGMVCLHSSFGRRDEGEGRHLITRGRRIAGSRDDRRLAEKAPHTRTKVRLTRSHSLGKVKLVS